MPSYMSYPGGWGIVLQGKTRNAWWSLSLVLALTLVAAWPTVQTVRAATGRFTAAQTVNVRSCAALDCPVIDSGDLGEAVPVVGSLINGFYPVTWNGTEGYVFAAYLNPGSTAPWFVEGDTSCKRVAFVFDIGIGYTPSQSVVDTLLQKGAAATMFPMGSFARSQPAYLRQLADAGFVIGTHGDKNLMLSAQSATTIRADVNASITSIESVIGRPIDPYHTPYAADTSNNVRTVVSDMGLMPVGWRVAANDYASTATASAVTTRVLGSMYPGAVVEFHLDGPATPQSTAMALPGIIDQLRDQGYRFVTVPEMLIPCSTALPTYPDRAQVVGTGGAGVRCRIAPNTSSGVITVLAEGATVPTRGPATGGWVPVTCAGQAGWMYSTYARLFMSSPPIPTPTPTPTNPTPTPTPGGSTTGTVTNTGGSNLRCRAAASTSGGVITLLAPGTVVPVRGATSNGWVPVRCANRDGWVSAQYLTISSGTSPPSTPPPSTGTTGMVVNTGGDSLRCRTGAGTSYAIITSLAPGSTVPVRGAPTNGWLPVVCGSRNGFVSATYLRIN